MKKFISLFVVCLAAFVLVMSLSSCGTTPEKAVNVTISFEAGEELLYIGKIDVEGENPTVLDAVNAVYDITDEISIVVDDSKGEVESIGVYKASKVEDNDYYWTFYINGEKPDTGDADNTAITDGMEIEFKFFVMTQNEDGTFNHTEYDSSSNVFTEDGEDAED